MFARKVGRRFWRRHLLKLATLALLACALLFAYARAQKKSTGAYPLAADLPRGALLYAQFSDLPALIKRWDESKLKERYLASTNFQQFQSRHLALKLIERWEEFNNALGFPLDALALGQAAENRAALAVYDIGRLEMVFIAPVGEDKLAATKFFQNMDQFEETELPGGTVYYSREVEADRGRRQQKFAFASVRGRLVVATSELLLLRTLANISGRAKNDRLSDDTSFKTLSAEVTPHFLTVWMNQSKLNDDWYFKHYWIMRNVEQLKNIRACVLDLELQEGKWIEHRNFLLTDQTANSSSFIPSAAAQRISAFVPDDAPFFKLRALDEAGVAASLVRDTFMDRLTDEGKAAGPGWKWQSYDDSDFYPANEGEGSGYGGYYSLDPSFDSLIDDPIDAKVEDETELAHARLRRETERNFVEGLRASIEAARPAYAATVASPQGSTGPLFVEFRRGAVLTLQSHGAFNRQAFESAISGLAASRLMITGSGAGLNWSDGPCGAQQQCRLLTLPMLGWTLCYALRGPDLVLANSPELLQAMLEGSNASRSVDSNSSLPFHDLTVIRFDRREQAFDSLMRKLDAPRVKAYWEERRKKEQGNGEGPSQEFFSGNIASLLDVASPVREVRIKRNLLPSRLREEVEIILK
ncbi:MAG TPA: hypothetical protein VM911_18325 [Pyrinomonadaceae bacterium]|jgi:hypothetical protein|nr:hypothetical protein [Pyrinomonadaceae bacterium]